MFRKSSSGLLSLAALLICASASGGTHAFDKEMTPILKDYVVVQERLAADKFSGVGQAAESIAKHAQKLKPKSVTGRHAEHYKDIPKKVMVAASALARARDLASARAAFKELSMPMAMWATMSKPHGIDVMFCSMAKGSWLQKRGEVRNPYYGAKMLTCGELVGGAAHAAKTTEHEHHGAHE